MYIMYINKTIIRRYIVMLMITSLNKTSIYTTGKRLLLRDFRSNGIIFMNFSVVLTVAMVMPLKDFGRCGILFMTVCLLL
jgi:hypothetical protein